jgi:hypothetical protein
MMPIEKKETKLVDSRREQTLKANVIGYNNLVKAGQAIKPIIDKYTAENDIKLNDDGSIYKKQKDELNRLIKEATEKTKLQRFKIRACKYDRGVELCVDIRNIYYEAADANGMTSRQPLDCLVYSTVGDWRANNFERKTVTIKQVRAAADKITKLYAKKRDLEQKMRAIYQPFSSFGEVANRYKCADL